MSRGGSISSVIRLRSGWPRIPISILSRNNRSLFPKEPPTQLPPRALYPAIPSIFHRKSLFLWPHHILTQLLTNHGCFRSYLHKMKKAATPLCSCPEKIEQRARHLMTECSLFSKDRPAVLQNLPLPLMMQFHIHTVDVHRLIENIIQMLQEQSKRDQIV
jgi:hypothetical protein